MQAAAIDTDEFVRFRPSVKHAPVDREEVRKMLADATSGLTPEVVPGFTGIKPLPPRKCLSIAVPKKARRTTSVEVDSLIALVGGTAMLAQIMGLKAESLSRWSVLVPSRHEQRCRYIQANWKTVERALKFLEKYGDFHIAAQRTDMLVSDLRALLDNFNLTHLYQSPSKGK